MEIPVIGSYSYSELSSLFGMFLSLKRFYSGEDFADGCGKYFPGFMIP
jgi:hypothetical protein